LYLFRWWIFIFYFDKNGYNGLSFVRRQAPFSSVRLEDEDFEINLSEEKALKIKQKNNSESLMEECIDNFWYLY